MHQLTLPDVISVFAGFSRWIVAEIIQSTKSHVPESIIEVCHAINQSL
jgi:hypothetical protein